VKKTSLFLILLLALATPSIAFARVTNIQTLMVAIVNIAVWIVFTGIVVISFVYAGVLFLTSSGDMEKVRTARRAFIWGIAGVVVGILAFWIIDIISRILS